MIRPLKESDIPTIRNIYENANNANDLPVEVDYFKKDALKYVSETIYKCENAVFEIEGSVKGIISVSKDFIPQELLLTPPAAVNIYHLLPFKKILS